MAFPSQGFSSKLSPRSILTIRTVTLAFMRALSFAQPSLLFNPFQPLICDLSGCRSPREWLYCLPCLQRASKSATNPSRRTSDGQAPPTAASGRPLSQPQCLVSGPTAKRGRGLPARSRGMVEVEGSKLYYEECGTGPEAVVLIHGGIAHSAVWDHVWPYVLQTVPHHPLRPPRLRPFSRRHILVYRDRGSRRATPQSKSEACDSCRQFPWRRAFHRLHAPISPPGSPARPGRRGCQRLPLYRSFPQPWHSQFPTLQERGRRQWPLQLGKGQVPARFWARRRPGNASSISSPQIRRTWHTPIPRVQPDPRCRA